MGRTENFYASIPFAVSEITQDGKLENPNNALCTLLGIPATGSSLGDILAIPEDQEWIEKSVANLQEKENVLLLKKVTGCAFMASVSITASPEDPDKKLFWINNASHLERTNTSLKTFFDLAPQPLLVCHPLSANIMRLNRAAADLFGFDPEDRESWGRLDEIINPGTRQTIFRKVTEDKEIDDMRLMVLDSHHSRIAASLSARFIGLGGGSCILISFKTGLAKLAEDTEQTNKEVVAAEAAEPILNATPVPLIASTLENGKIARLNMPASRLLEVDKTDVEEGKDKLNSFFDKDETRDLLDQIKLKGEVTNSEISAKTSSGKEFTCYASGRRAEVDGREFAVIGLSDTPPPDTTGYEDFFDQAPFPMLLVENTDRAFIKRLNRRAHELFIADDSSDIRDLRLKHILGLRVYNQLRKKIETAGFADDFETTLTTAYEEEISCLLSGHNVVLNGEELILVGINDITERKESELTLERFFNAAPLPMILSRLEDGKVTRINRRASELFATPIDVERAAHGLKDFFGEEETGTFFETIQKGGFVDDFEVSIETPYGETIWGLLSGQLIKIDGETCVMTGVNDITERKQVEEALKESREEAVQATRQKSTFLSTMSHEIRTPMTGVLGMLELLHMTRLDEEQVAAVSVVKDSATALLTIIDDILDFSKIEAGRLKIENIDFNIREVVESAVELMGARARSKGLELVCNIDPQIPTNMMGDPTRLRQIILNLLGNAVKFTSSGVITTRVSCLLQSDKNVFLRFEVQDQGIGISQEKLRLLFKPFSQTDASTSRHFGGTGLGLSICKALVELMKGQISVISEEGEGSTFWFEVNLDEAEDQPEVKYDDLRDLNLIVIQKNEETRETYQRTLTECGASVLTAESLKDAKKDKKFKKVEIAIIDHRHDDFDGFALAKQLCDEQGIAPEKIILTSSDYAEHVMSDARKMGLGGRTFKPVRSSVLMKQVCTVAGRCTGPIDRVEIKPRPQMDRDAAIATGKMVLFAEDNPTNQMVIGKQLARLGYAYDIAENGAIAFEKLQETDYALLLTDIRMPEMNGLDLSLSVRKQEITEKTEKRLPIVALTANATAEDADTCLSAGMDDYLVKPLKFEKLGEAMHKWLPLDPEEESSSEPAPEKDSPPSSEESAGSPINLAQLGEILGMEDDEMFAEILTFFVQTMDELMAELDDTIQSGNAESISDKAHAAKGASRNAGAEDLGNLFENMEKNIFTMSEEDINTLHESIKNDVAKVKDYVAALGS